MADLEVFGRQSALRANEVILTWELEDGSVAAAVFDIVTDENHEWTNTITEHEIEEGANETDHVKPNLDRFSVVGYISNSPLLTNPGVLYQGSFKQIELQLPPQPLKIGVSSLISAGVAALGDALLGANTPKLVTFRFDEYQDRVRAAGLFLDEARRRAAPVRILTRVKDYEGMQFGSITVTRTPDDGTGATFSVSLQELKTASSEIVAAPQPAELTGQTRTEAGSKHASEDDPTKATQRQSILSQLKDPDSNLRKQLRDLGVPL